MTRDIRIVDTLMGNCNSFYGVILLDEFIVIGQPGLFVQFKLDLCDLTHMHDQEQFIIHRVDCLDGKSAVELDFLALIVEEVDIALVPEVYQYLALESVAPYFQFLILSYCDDLELVTSHGMVA